MAENLDNQSFGNFSIEDTMELGAGNAELLKDLIAPETSTGSPDDLKDIKDEPKQQEQKAPTQKEESKEPKEDSGKFLSDFLSGDGEDEDDEEEEELKPPVQTKAPKKQEAKQPEPSEEEDEEEAPSQFSALANDLFKLGVFSKDDDEDISISTQIGRAHV